MRLILKKEVVYHPNEKHTEVAELEKVETPNVKTAQELVIFKPSG